jgi:hypothetical protein
MDEANLRLEPGVVLNCFHAITYANASEKLNPLAGVPHVGKIELAVTIQFHAGKLFVESWRNGIGCGAGVDRNEIARRANPFGRDVRDVIELASIGRRLDVPGLESSILGLWNPLRP